MAQQHKNDMYGDIEARDENDPGVQPPIPSATIVLLRDGTDGPEVLMLKKNSKITFGGMWVFPGGKIDAADYADNPETDAQRARQGAEKDSQLEQAARTAAAREAQEEAGIELEPNDFVWFAHWTPPPGPAKRFATWFFAATAESDEIQIDDGEIKDHAWIRPAQAIERHAQGEIDLAPPTWVTLYQLSLRTPVSAILDHFNSTAAKIYSTRVAKDAEGVRVAMWSGDAGYEPWDAGAQGDRHRLVMSPGGFEFQNSVEDY